MRIWKWSCKLSFFVWNSLCATTSTWANSIPTKHLHLSHLSILSKLSFQFSLCVRFECAPNTFVKIVCLQQHPPPSYDTKSHQFETLLSYTLLLLFYFHFPFPLLFRFFSNEVFSQEAPERILLAFPDSTLLPRESESINKVAEIESKQILNSAHSCVNFDSIHLVESWRLELKNKIL